MAENKNYTIKVYRSDDENQNRQLYMSKKNVRRKWISVCSDVNEHGDKQVYEKCLVQAFNLTEFVLDNWIEETFRIHNNSGNLERIFREGEKPKENGTYRFIKQKVVINFHKSITSGFGGKVEIVQKLGITLPAEIDTVRKNRNKYAHGTDTYKNSTREELDDFATVQMYMDTLGQLLVALGRLPEELIRPAYVNMKLEVGHMLGYENKYSVLEQLKKGKECRVFAGRNGKNQKDIYIKEILPRPDLLDIYWGSKENLMKMVGNGIVRTEDVILKNNACYIVTERVEGEKLYDFLKAHQTDNETKKDLLYQVKKIVATMKKNPNVCSEFKESDFVVDAGGDLWLTQYEFGKMQLAPEEVIRRFEMILAIEEESTVVIEASVATETEVELEIVEHQEGKQIEVEQTHIEAEAERPRLEAEIQQTKVEPEAKMSESAFDKDDMTYVVSSKMNLQDEMVRMDAGSNPNDWSKLLYTIGACGGILVILWALSVLIA